MIQTSNLLLAPVSEPQHGTDATSAPAVADLPINAAIIHSNLPLARKAWQKLQDIEDTTEGIYLDHITEIDLNALFENDDPTEKAASVAEADIIILALDKAELPEAWRDWFIVWAHLREPKVGTLVCIFGGCACGWCGARIREFLEGLAQISQLEVVHH